MQLSGPRPVVPVVVVVSAVVALGVTAAVVLAGVLLREPPAPGVGTPPAGPLARLAPAAGRVDVARAVGSLAVLRDFDRARARAWADGDVAALRRLYVPTSAAGRRDAAMLRAWVRRGMRVDGLTMQVLAVELRRRTDDRIVLLVTDRVAAAVAVRAATGERTALPRDGPSTRRLAFVRSGKRWLLASAQEAAPPDPGDSAVASTASTSGSAKP